MIAVTRPVSFPIWSVRDDGSSIRDRLTWAMVAPSATHLATEANAVGVVAERLVPGEAHADQADRRHHRDGDRGAPRPRPERVGGDPQDPGEHDEGRQAAGHEGPGAARPEGRRVGDEQDRDQQDGDDGQVAVRRLQAGLAAAQPGPERDDREPGEQRRDQEREHGLLLVEHDELQDHRHRFEQGADLERDQPRAVARRGRRGRPGPEQRRRRSPARWRAGRRGGPCRPGGRALPPSAAAGPARPSPRGSRARGR